jgi:hypothetical protein
MDILRENLHDFSGLLEGTLSYKSFYAKSKIDSLLRLDCIEKRFVLLFKFMPIGLLQYCFETYIK